MASASATRAQWAGYQAPDETAERTEDQWAEIKLPEEMRDTYGQQPYIEFISDDERTRLGFACLPVVLDETTEDLDEMIHRWGSSDETLDTSNSTESPEDATGHDFCLDSKTQALVTELNTPAWPAWLSHLALPGGPPLPKTPARTEGTTAASQDDLAEFLHDSPHVDGINSSSGVAGCTPPPSPGPSSHVLKAAITMTQPGQPSQHALEGHVPPTPQSPLSQSPEALAESDFLPQAATPEAAHEYASSHEEKTMGVTKPSSDATSSRAVTYPPLPMPKSSIPPTNEPGEAVIGNLEMSDDPPDSMEVSFGKCPPAETGHAALIPPPEHTAVAVDVARIADTVVVADNRVGPLLEDVASSADPSSPPPAHVSVVDVIPTFTEATVAEISRELAPEVAPLEALRRPADQPAEPVAHHSLSWGAELDTTDEISSPFAPGFAPSGEMVRLQFAEGLVHLKVDAGLLAGRITTAEAVSSPSAQDSVADPNVEVAAAKPSNPPIEEIAAAGDIATMAEMVSASVSVAEPPSSMAAASDGDDTLGMEFTSPAAAAGVDDSTTVSFTITPALAAIGQSAWAVWREQPSDVDGDESDTDALSEVEPSSHPVSEWEPRPFHVESRCVRQAREKLAALEGRERHPTCPGNSRVLQMLGGQLQVHTVQEIDITPTAYTKINAPQEVELAPMAGAKIGTSQEVDTEQQRDTSMEPCDVVHSSLIAEHEKGEQEEWHMPVVEEVTAVNNKNDDSDEDIVIVGDTCEDVGVEPTVSAVANKGQVVTPPQDGTCADARDGRIESALIGEHGTSVDNDDAVAYPNNLHVGSNTPHEDDVEHASSTSPSLAAAAVNITQTVFASAPPELISMAEHADSNSPHSNQPPFTSGANTQEAPAVKQTSLSSYARSASPSSPPISPSVSNIPATPFGPIRPNNIAALLNPRDQNVGVPSPETFSPGSRPRNPTPFNYAQVSSFEPSRLPTMPTAYQTYRAPSSRSLINLPPRNSRSPFSAYHRSWEDTTSAIRATVSNLPPDSPEQAWFGYPLSLSMGPTSHGSALTSNPSAYAFSGLSDHVPPTSANRPSIQAGLEKTFGHDDEEEVDALVDPEDASASDDSLPAPRSTVHELDFIPNDDDAVRSQAAPSRKRRSSPAPSRYTVTNATGSSKRARTTKVSRQPAKNTRTSPPQTVRARAAKKTRARGPQTKEPPAQADEVSMEPKPIAIHTPTPGPSMRTRREGRVKSFPARDVSAQGLSPTSTESVQLHAEVVSADTVPISSRTRSYGRVLEPQVVDAVVINQVGPEQPPSASSRTRARRHVQAPSPQGTVTDAVRSVQVPFKRKRTVSIKRAVPITGLDEPEKSPPTMPFVEQDAPPQPAATVSNPAVAKSAADASHKKRSVNWSEEEIDIFKAFWTAYEVNNPGMKGTLAAAAECAALMQKAGYARTMRACLTRFQKFGAVSK